MAGLLVCALLLMQGIGLLHRVLHSDGPGHVQHDQGRLQDLFAHEEGSADCQIFDQLSLDDGLDIDSGATHAAPPAQLPAPGLQAPNVASQAAAYRARGPPRLA